MLWSFCIAVERLRIGRLDAAEDRDEVGLAHHLQDLGRLAMLSVASQASRSG